MSEVEREELCDLLDKVGVPIEFIIRETFLGYRYRKMTKHLYHDDSSIPTQLIRLYYGLNPGEVEFDNLRKSFIKKYVKNESEIEGVNDLGIHGKEEIEGLAEMYEFLHSKELDDNFSVYSLKDLHRKLFSHAPYPECAGNFRNDYVGLIGSGIGLCDYWMISRELYALSPQVDYLHQLSKVVRNSGNVDELLSFLDLCVELKCKLIWIHPFLDGNGRTIRAFINKLLEDAGFPAIYIKANERIEYQKAMKLAIGENDYSSIKEFYRYKICDSIIELDINDRIQRRNQKNSTSTGKKYIKQ